MSASLSHDHIFSDKLYFELSFILLFALPLELGMNYVSFTIYVCVCDVCFCECVMSLAWPCLSDTEPCCQCVCLCDEEMKLWSAPPSTSQHWQAQNETLNTSQSVKRAAKIETDLLFLSSPTKLIVLTTCYIRYDKWPQIEVSSPTRCLSIFQTLSTKLLLSVVHLD